MATVHRLSRAQARRLAVSAQLLDQPRPADLMDVVRGLTVLQLDPTQVIAPSADLVVWSRLGSAYQRHELRDALDEQRLVEHLGLVRTPDYLALLRADMAEWPGRGPLRPWQESLREWVRANDGTRREILDLLRSDGPLPQAVLPDTCARAWRSSGWSDGKSLGKLLDVMVVRGEIAAAGREGRERLWDLAERVYPDDTVVPAQEARRERDARRLRALGLARAKAPEAPGGEPDDVGEAGEPAVVDGVPGKWRVDPSLLDRSFAGRTALLSPLDRLVKDRKRIDDLFEFDYQLEMYKPAAVRIWGYWAMPVLHHDRLVGKLDAAADRKDGVLRVHAIHQDVPFTREMSVAVDREIRDLAQWLELELEVAS